MVVSVTDKAAAAASEKKTTPSTLPKASFLMTSDEAESSIKAEEARSKARRDEAGRLWRFTISQKTGVGKEFPILFLDGDLNEKGLFEGLPQYNEHTLMIDGRPNHFICTNHEEPCPICAMPGKEGNAATVTLFTVLDMTPYTILKGDRAGTVVPFSKKILAAKRQTRARLLRLAGKHGGLRGVKLDATRTGDMSPNTGDAFDFDYKLSEEELAEKFGGEDQTGHMPADWAKELVYRTADELRELGVGASPVGIQGGFTGNGADVADAF